jgi:nitric oxide reductase NorE protein
MGPGPGLTGAGPIFIGKRQIVMNQQDALSAGLERQPGTNGIWTFVFIDMIVFSLMFLVFLSEKFRLPKVYAAGQAHMDFRIGLTNTLLLITSSLFMADAVAAARQRAALAVKRNLLACLACGAAFCVNKIFEYHSKLSAGITPAPDSFYSFYFFITGAHFLHVVGAMIFIVHCVTQDQQAIVQEN